MDRELAAWLEELKEEFVFSSAESSNQALENQHSFGWNEEQRMGISPLDFASFIQGCCKVVSQKTHEPAVFYAWADEQAGQLRFSAISGRPNSLPFSCEVVLSPLEEIVERVISMDGSTFSGGHSYLKVWVQKIAPL